MKFVKLSKEYAESKAIFTNSDWLKFFEEWMNKLPSSIDDPNIKTLRDRKRTTLTEIRKDKDTREAFWRLFGKGEVPDTIPPGPLNVSS